MRKLKPLKRDASAYRRIIEAVRVVTKFRAPLAGLLTPSRKEAEAITVEVFSALAREINQTGRVSIPGFGTFSIRYRKARKIRVPPSARENPGEIVSLAATRTVGFRKAKTWKVGGR
jgi:DNA-binding protein HU-beta